VNYVIFKNKLETGGFKAIFYVVNVLFEKCMFCAGKSDFIALTGCLFEFSDKMKQLRVFFLVMKKERFCCRNGYKFVWSFG